MFISSERTTEFIIHWLHAQFPQRCFTRILFQFLGKNEINTVCNNENIGTNNYLFNLTCLWMLFYRYVCKPYTQKFFPLSNAILISPRRKQNKVSGIEWVEQVKSLSGKNLATNYCSDGSWRPAHTLSYEEKARVYIFNQFFWQEKEMPDR